MLQHWFQIMVSNRIDILKRVFRFSMHWNVCIIRTITIFSMTRSLPTTTIHVSREVDYLRLNFSHFFFYPLETRVCAALARPGRFLPSTNKWYSISQNGLGSLKWQDFANISSLDSTDKIMHNSSSCGILKQLFSQQAFATKKSFLNKVPNYNQVVRLCNFEPSSLT